MLNRSGPTGQINSIQVLRGVAALLVVFHHVCLCFANCGSQDSVIARQTGLRELGACGVDIFFVISGFVMIVTSAAKPRLQRSRRSFILLRVIRIVPLYWLYTTCLVAILPLPFVFANNKSHFTWDYILKSYLFIPAPNAQGALHPLLDQGWTLFFEMLFYVLFALFLRTTSGVAICGISAILLSLVWYGLAFLPQHAIGQFYTDPILLEFTLGMLAGWLYLRGAPFSRALMAAVFVASIAGFLASMRDDPIHVQRLVHWGIPSFGLLLSLAWLEQSGAIQRWSRVLLLCGDSSYSIYLTHGFVLLPLGSVLKRVSLPAGAADLALIVVCVLCVVPGLISYRLIEKPMTERLKSLLISPRKIPGV